jgi:hypothetical protein
MEISWFDLSASRERGFLELTTSVKSRVVAVTPDPAAIRVAHGHGLSNRQIALKLGCTHRTIAEALRRLNLTTNNPRGRPPEDMGNGTFKCTVCRGSFPLEDFPFVRNSQDGRRQGKCRICRNIQISTSIMSDPLTYLRHHQLNIATRCRAKGIEFSLPSGYLGRLWIAQKGLCFYTDLPIVLERLRGGIQNDSVSVDRVNPDNGYCVSNVVLCINRINSIKRDVSLVELSDWMPGWYERVITRLPSLVLATDGDF